MTGRAIEDDYEAMIALVRSALGPGAHIVAVDSFELQARRPDGSVATSVYDRSRKARWQRLGDALRAISHKGQP
jgi:hypothetical protein